MSAAQGLGTGDLLDRIVELGPGAGGRDDAEDPDDTVRLAVIGRPNVGKSSLVNRFAGAERVIVSPVAGTTRDAIDLPIEFEGRQLVLVDTAGLRRQAKVGESVEYYTSLRSRRAAERADVALVVCDATDGITAQDLRVAELAMRSGCATALVLNKWDLAGADEVDLDHERARAHQKLRLRPRVLTASAKTGRHVERLLVEAVALADRRAGRIPTPQLNRFLSDVVAARQPPAGGPRHSGHRLRLLFMTQTGERPPRFSIQVNSRARVTRDYAYYVENRLRERYRLEGVPVIIDFVERNERRAPARRPPDGRRAEPGPERYGRLNRRINRPKLLHCCVRCQRSRGRISRFPRCPGAAARPARGAPPRADAARRFRRRRLALAGGAARGRGGDRGRRRARARAARARAPPATGAAAIVPADALAYVHLSTDPGRPPSRRARQARRALPRLAAARGRRAEPPAPDRRRLELGVTSLTAIRPWLGKEASLALLAAPSGAVQPLVVLEVADPRAHRRS